MLGLVLVRCRIRRTERRLYAHRPGFAVRQKARWLIVTAASCIRRGLARYQTGENCASQGLASRDSSVTPCRVLPEVSRPLHASRGVSLSPFLEAVAHVLSYSLVVANNQVLPPSRAVPGCLARKYSHVCRLIGCNALHTRKRLRRLVKIAVVMRMLGEASGWCPPGTGRQTSKRISWSITRA